MASPYEIQDYGLPLDERYRIEILEEADDVGPEDVLAFWEREDAMSAEDARWRVHEVQLVAIERDEGVVGASTVFLNDVPFMRMELWHHRGYVAREHRLSSIGLLMGLNGRDLLKQRFVEGEDIRAGGLLWEVENEKLRKDFPQALWMPMEMLFVAENQRGDHVRIHWFPGAKAPPPG